MSTIATNMGRMTPKRVQRAIANPNEVELWCQDYKATVLKDSAGNPKELRMACNNRLCCRPKYGKIGVHIWDLSTGEYRTEEMPKF